MGTTHSASDFDDLIRADARSSLDLFNKAEQEWIIPRLEKLTGDFSLCPSTNEGMLQILSKMYRGLVVHFSEPDEENEVTELIAFRLHDDETDHARFFFILRRLYSDDVTKYFNVHHEEKSELQLKYEDELISIDVLNSEKQMLDIQNIASLPSETKDRIIGSGCCFYAISQVDFCKEKLADLKSQHMKRKDDLSDLLLGS